MHYCINCGNRIENENDLCEICGTDIKELLEFKEKMENMNINSNQGRFQDIKEKLIKNLILYITRPVTFIKDKSSSFTARFTTIFIFLISILDFFVNRATSNICINHLKDLLKKKMENPVQINEYENRGISYNTINFLVDQFERLSKKAIASSSSLVCFIFIIVFSLLIYSVTRFVFRSKGKLINIFNGVLLSTSYFIFIKAIAIIFINLSTKTFLFIYLIDIILFFILIYRTIGFTTELSEDKLFMLYPLIILFIVIFFTKAFKAVLGETLCFDSYKQSIMYILEYTLSQ